MEKELKKVEAKTPVQAYKVAKDRYGEAFEILSAKQKRDDQGKLYTQLIVEVPKVAATKDADERTITQTVKELFVRKGLDAEWIEAELNRLAETLIEPSKEELVTALLERIDEAIEVRPEQIDQKRIVMLVGPTGVGKSTTIAKLAARYTYLLETPLKVLIINLDNYKVGAIEQLQQYAQIMEVDYKPIAEIESFKEALSKIDSYDVVLIDTMGISPFDMEKFTSTIAYVQEAGSFDLQKLLTVSATVKYEDVAAIYEHFLFIGLDGLVITKIDETDHLGSVLNFMLKFQLPLYYISTGQEVPDDLLVADKGYLLTKFFGTFDDDCNTG